MTVDEMEKAFDKEEQIKQEEAEKIEMEPYMPLTTTNWFCTFLCMNIPIIGLLYLLILSFSKSQPLKRDFARAYIMYQILFLSISVILILVFCYYGLEIADNAIKFMQEL